MKPKTAHNKLRAVFGLDRVRRVKILLDRVNYINFYGELHVAG